MIEKEGSSRVHHARQQAGRGCFRLLQVLTVLNEVINVFFSRKKLNSKRPKLAVVDLCERSSTTVTHDAFLFTNLDNPCGYSAIILLPIFQTNARYNVEFVNKHMHQLDLCTRSCLLKLDEL